MQDDGTFLVDVQLPWGERQAYKYVLDGEWMVREDEDKEWGKSLAQPCSAAAGTGADRSRRPLWKCEQREFRLDAQNMLPRATR